MHGKRHMCTCAMIHTNTRMSGRSCSLVCMDVCICVYVYRNVYVCMRVCICITHPYIDTDAPYTIHVHNIRAKKHMCTYTTIHTHTRMSGHSCSLFVWMCARVYMCLQCACMCMCVNQHQFNTYLHLTSAYQITHICILKQASIHTIHVHNMHAK